MSKHDVPAVQRWREIIERHRSSGSSIAAFCRDNKIAVSSFYAWKRRLADSPAAEACGFVEAKISETCTSSSSSKIQVRLRGGRRLIVGRGFDRHLLAQVVAVMEGLP